MFNYSEGLQNPELMIRRILIHSKSRARKTQVIKVLSKILYSHLQGGDEYKIGLSPTGLIVDGPWGKKMPLRDLADGYKSTFLWIADFLGWALSYKQNLKSFKEIAGIVLIDEIEQHLHPKWKKKIVYYLRQEFPQVQFIATTHSPLVASSIGKPSQKVDVDKLIHFALHDKNNVIKYESKPLKALDVDQMLASKAFDYTTTEDPEWESILKVASEYATRRNLTKDEHKLFLSLKELIQQEMFEGKTSIQRLIQAKKYQELGKKVKAKEKKLLAE